jgi:hypothetical protein
VVNNLLYVVGGMGQDGRDLRSAEVYDFEAGTWTDLPPLPDDRTILTTAVVGYKGRVFVMGCLKTGARWRCWPCRTRTRGLPTTMRCSRLPSSGPWAQCCVVHPLGDSSIKFNVEKDEFTATCRAP